jgi:hypothetical protein
MIRGRVPIIGKETKVSQTNNDRLVRPLLNSAVSVLGPFVRMSPLGNEKDPITNLELSLFTVLPTV